MKDVLLCDNAAALTDIADKGGNLSPSLKSLRGTARQSGPLSARQRINGEKMTAPGRMKLIVMKCSAPRMKSEIH